MLPALGPAADATGHSVSQRADSTRDRLPDSSATGGSAPACDYNAGRSEPAYRKSDRVDQGELREAVAGGRTRTTGGHGRIHTPQSFSSVNGYESASVPETTAAACSAGPHAHRWSRRRERGLRGWVRKRQPI